LQPTETVQQPTTHAQGFAPAPEPSREATPTTPEQGNWFHRNRWFTKGPLTYTGYQFFRSAMASIPYGFAMAAVHRGMGFLRVWGEKTGLSSSVAAQGIAALDEKMAQSSALKAQLVKAPELAHTLEPKISKLASEMEAAMLKGNKALLGRNVARFASSPINQAFQIAAGFTLFRFVGGLIKGQRDRVMDETNGAAETNRESRNWWQNIKTMARTNWSAESTATPIAALTLGFASANFKGLANNAPKLNPGESWGAGIKRAVLHPEAKLLQNAAIWTIAYSIFFEASERIFKDKQLKRGKWLGNVNSLKNTPHDPNVGGYAADGHTDEFHKDKAPPKPKLDLLTGDPSICRFAFRRVLPVAVGISAYAFLKRSAYLKVGGPMSVVTHADAAAGMGENLKLFGKDAWREGAATAMFGALWMATDAWGSWYDKFFAKLQDKASHSPVTPHQSQKFAELESRIAAKEAAQGRAA